MNVLPAAPPAPHDAATRGRRPAGDDPSSFGTLLAGQVDERGDGPARPAPADEGRQRR